MQTVFSGPRVDFEKKKKRSSARQPSPEQCISWLSESSQHGVIFRGGVWMACTRQLAYVFDRVCIGHRLPKETVEDVPLFLNTLARNGSILFGTLRDTNSDRGNIVIVRFSPEETLYAVGILDCLTVHALGEVTKGHGTLLYRLRLSEILQMLSGRENARSRGGSTIKGLSTLFSRFTTYLHFRKVGWLPKSGLQYGSDFVLYKNHPSLVHSEYCVIIHPFREVKAVAHKTDSLAREFKRYLECHFSLAEATFLSGDWTSLQAASRLCGQVNKSFVFAFLPCVQDVNFPANNNFYIFWMKVMCVARFISEKK